MSMSKKYIAVLTGHKLAPTTLTNKIREIFNAISINVLFIENKDIEKGILNNNAISFVMPAIDGEKSTYPEILTDISKSIITRYCLEGGVIWAHCAAPYEISSSLQYTKSNGYKKIRTNTMGLLPYHSFGPISPPKQNHTQNPRDLCLMPVKYYDLRGIAHETKILYGCGPAFSGAIDKNTKIIASYNTDENNSPALISHKYGKGIIISSGILPYISTEDISQNSHMVDFKGLNIRQLKQDMLPYEEMRETIFIRQCFEVIRHNINTGKLARKLQFAL